ncbi:nuclear receptor coactivator 7-like [Salarias fasciatus]|nr:nuclear receptor coactivator 7-like [Salarias fasciatus]XP_029942832.1 nuclear receptor coactivator 7-like [Salarias fasciatus]
MDGASQRSKTSGYFSQMNARWGSRLPPGVSQPPRFAQRPWERPPLAPEPQGGAAGSHAPHIRNPQLRQYYLQGTSWDLSRTLLTDVSSGGGPGSPLLVHTEESAAADPELDLDSKVEQQVEQQAEQQAEADQASSPEAEYDKLLDVEAVPMPDGQLCLLALPPECCQGEGPEATPYLKLFCSYITDRKGVISGILLVTSNKLFFDPCKTHPLVREHGCEDYLLSCSVDSLQSVCFFSDISHVHFNPCQQRRRHRNLFQRLKSPRSSSSTIPAGRSLKQEEAELEREVEVELERSPLAFCCGGPDAGGAVQAELQQAGQPGGPAPPRPAAGGPAAGGPAAGGPAAGGPAALRFVRLRVRPGSGRGRPGAGLHLGPDQHCSRRDAWLALSQESAERLQAHLQLCRPHLDTLQGDADPDHEDFVLLEDREAEDASQKPGGSGDDWEMVSMEDSGDRPAQGPEPDPEGLQQVLETSHILQAEHVRELSRELPAWTEGRAWTLSYSTSRHGASLQSLYRRLRAADSPVLLVIRDALDEVFGAFLSHPLRPSEEFYGTGETFLFMLHPRFKCFRWTGDNCFFIKGYRDAFAIGGGSGHFGLWLDEDLYLGHSSPCYTFNNCCLSETSDFRVTELEVWTFS